VQRYGSIANLQRATMDELSHVVSKKSAEKILRHFKPPNGTA